jgi:glycosyltransferase involved in cell wall biosynthesis
VRVLREAVARAEADGSLAGVSCRIIHNDGPHGVAANFQHAISACSGDVIALSDQDDVWAPGRLKTLVEHLQRNGDLMLLHSDARMVDESGTPLGYSLFEAISLLETERAQIHGGRGFEALLRRNLVTGATTVIRASLTRIAFPIPAGWLHDEWLAIVAGAIARFDVVEVKSMDYRQHGSNQIGQLKPTLGYRVRRLLEPRSSRNDRLLARAGSLVERLDALGELVPASYRELGRGKLEHEKCRSALPAARLKRIRPVLREYRSGAYERYGRGRPDVLRDLVQSAK